MRQVILRAAFIVIAASAATPSGAAASGQNASVSAPATAGIQPLSPDDPISARMDSNMSFNFGPFGKRIEARDLPIVGKQVVGGTVYWAVQFGAKTAPILLVNDEGEIFALPGPDGQLRPDKRLTPRDARLKPLPR